MDREVDARTRLCPMERAADGLCRASECMAWRWATELHRQSIRCPDRYATTEQGQVRPARAVGWAFVPGDDDGPAQWLEPEAQARTRRLGYCGLAGKP